MAVNDLMENNEERPAYLRFEVRAVKDPKATMKAGHYVSMDEDWALVSALGSRDIFSKKASKWFVEVEKSVERGRVPIKHLELYREIYARWKKGLEPPVDGTSVKDWNALSPAQCENMIKSGIRTIEDMAQATDEGMRHIGAGASDLRIKAKAWLQADKGPLIEEMAELRNENRQRQGTIDSLQEQIRLLQIRVEGQVTPNPTREYTPHTPEQIAKSEDTANAEVRKMLISEYEAKFGKKPHGRMKDETIRESLR